MNMVLVDTSSWVHMRRADGATVPAADILIAACAQFHKAELEHSDSDLDRLETL